MAAATRWTHAWPHAATRRRTRGRSDDDEGGCDGSASRVRDGSDCGGDGDESDDGDDGDGDESDYGDESDDGIVIVGRLDVLVREAKSEPARRRNNLQYPTSQHAVPPTDGRKVLQIYLQYPCPRSETTTDNAPLS